MSPLVLTSPAISPKTISNITNDDGDAVVVEITGHGLAINDAVMLLIETPSTLAGGFFVAAVLDDNQFLIKRTVTADPVLGDDQSVDLGDAAMATLVRLDSLAENGEDSGYVIVASGLLSARNLKPVDMIVGATPQDTGGPATKLRDFFVSTAETVTLTLWR